MVILTLNEIELSPPLAQSINLLSKKIKFLSTEQMKKNRDRTWENWEFAETPRWMKFGNPDPRSPFVFTSSNAVRTAYFGLPKNQKSRNGMVQLGVHKTLSLRQKGQKCKLIESEWTNTGGTLKYPKKPVKENLWYHFFSWNAQKFEEFQFRFQT